MVGLDGVKLSQLKALIAVAEQKNFSEAAHQLQLSQSAISHAIATLEEELGVVLFLRGRRGAVLTPVGDRVLGHARTMFSALQRIGHEAELSRSLAGGEVRIASFRSAATHIIPRAMAQFRQQYPQLTASLTEHIDYAAVEQVLRDGKADVGITYLPSTTEFDTWELLRDEYLVFFPPDTPIPEPLTWEKLATYPLILGPDDDACYVTLHQHFAHHGFTKKPDYKVSEDSTIIGMVIQGLGISILPRLAAQPVPPQLQMRSLPTPFYRRLGVALLADALHPPPVFAFVDSLKQVPLGEASFASKIA
ncbi:MAG: LysR family transcriptional regulator [Cyanobacteria bacterium P01_A01_bin.135]